MILPIVYGLLSALSWGVADFLSRYPSKRIGYQLTSASVQIFSFAGMLVYVLVFSLDGLRRVILDPSMMMLNLLLGVLMFIGLLSLYKGYSSGVMSVVSPIASSYPAVAIVLGVVILSETIRAINILAILTILAGIILAGIKLSEVKSLRPLNSTNFVTTTAGFDSALITMVTFGVAILGLDVLSSAYGFIVPVMLMRGGAALIAFILYWISRSWRRANLSKRILYMILVLATLDSAGFLFLNLGLLSASDALPLVATLAGLGSPLTITLAGVFYKEKITKLQFAGITCMIFGVATLLYFS